MTGAAAPRGGRPCLAAGPSGARRATICDRERCSGQLRRGSRMETVLHDLRYASRMLRRSPAFAATILITLALGIGATTAVFSIVYGILLRPLPYPDPDRIVRLSEEHQGAVSPLTMPMLSNLTWFALAGSARTVEQLAAYRISQIHGLVARRLRSDGRGGRDAVVLRAGRRDASARPVLPRRRRRRRERQHDRVERSRVARALQRRSWHRRARRDPRGQAGNDRRRRTARVRIPYGRHADLDPSASPEAGGGRVARPSRNHERRLRPRPPQAGRDGGAG